MTQPTRLRHEGDVLSLGLLSMSTRVVSLMMSRWRGLAAASPPPPLPLPPHPPPPPPKKKEKKKKKPSHNASSQVTIHPKSAKTVFLSCARGDPGSRKTAHEWTTLPYNNGGS